MAELKINGSQTNILLFLQYHFGSLICAVIKAARQEGIDFRLHIIGFGLKAEETEQLKCAAKAGDGQYYDAADAGGLGEVLNEATTATVDEPASNFSVFAMKNGEPIDAYVKAYQAGTKTSAATARTYADTVLLYLPPGTYDLEVKPLENSDVNAMVVPKVQSFEEKITHQTVSFDGGKIQVTTSNNGQGWDTVVKIYAKADGKNIASGRTYGKTDVYEVNPGTYDVEVAALVVEGLETTYRMENVVVKAGETQTIAHNFTTGIALIGAKSAQGLVDAVVKIKEMNTQQNVASSRTYTSGNNNPKKVILTPGLYEIPLTALGDHKGKTETLTIEVKAGETIEKIIGF